MLLLVCCPTVLLLCALQETDNPDLRDRAYIYWRLLSTDPGALGCSAATQASYYLSSRLFLLSPSSTALRNTPQ